MKKLFYIVPVLFLSACGGNKSKEDKAAESAAVETKTPAASAAFNASFGELLNKYYALRDALVADDTTSANAAANSLITASTQVKLDELKSMDTSNIIIPTAKTYS